MAASREEFFAIMSAFPTGVAIVTTLDADGQPRGLTTNAVSSVSADPPMLLVCVDRTSRTLEALRHARRFVVNFMSDGGADLCALFASKADDKFASVAWEPGLGGVPLLVARRARDRRVPHRAGARGRRPPDPHRRRRGRPRARPGAGADPLLPPGLRQHADRCFVGAPRGFVDRAATRATPGRRRRRRSRRRASRCQPASARSATSSRVRDDALARERAAVPPVRRTSRRRARR